MVAAECILNYVYDSQMQVLKKIKQYLCYSKWSSHRHYFKRWKYWFIILFSLIVLYTVTLYVSLMDRAILLNLERRQFLSFLKCWRWCFMVSPVSINYSETVFISCGHFGFYLSVSYLGLITQCFSVLVCLCLKTNFCIQNED